MFKSLLIASALAAASLSSLAQAADFNPQPDPPGRHIKQALNPQPEPPGVQMRQQLNPQPEPPGVIRRTTDMSRAMRVPCPAQVQVTMNPTGSLAPWTYNKSPFFVTLDPLNKPRVEQNTLICYYKLLNQPAAFVIFQPQGPRHCTVNPTQNGFVCTP
ncbi:MAG: hypothetical protein AB1429_04295 [Pseudomonadota bacterium]|jgi:hypothetical protein